MTTLDIDDAWHVFNPADGHGLPRDPLRAILGPRTIGWISSQSASGAVNLAPYSFFSMLCDRPPIIGFSSIEAKDSLRNIEETGEFAFNLATRPNADAMNASSVPAPPDTDEFLLAGLEKAAGRVVRCPRVASAPVSMECRLIEIVQLRGVDGVAAAAWLILGEVICVHIRRDCLHDGRFDPAEAQIIQRAGYAADYFQVRPEGHFAMRRPSAGPNGAA